MHNETEIEQLFKQNYQKMYILAWVLLHDNDAAKDVVSDVFTDIVEGKITTRLDKTGSYLLVCIRNKCYNILSHQKVKDKVHQLLMLESEISIAPAEQAVDKLDEMLKFINEELTPQTSRIMQLHYQQKMTYKVIATQLDISEAAVYKHLAQGIKKLKQRFNP